MKQAYINATIYDLVVFKGYSFVKDSMGKNIDTDTSKLLQKYTYNSVSIIELIDTELISNEDIKLKVDYAKDVLHNRITLRNERATVSYIQIFVSNKKLSLEIENINENDYFERRFLGCFFIGVEDNHIDKKIDEPIMGKTVTKILTKNIKSDNLRYAEIGDWDDFLKEIEFSDTNKQTKESIPITYVFILMNILIWCLGMYYIYIRNSGIIYDAGIKNVFRMVEGEWWRLITPIFLHFEFMHLLANAYGIYIFGKSIEKIYGKRRFILIYLVSGVLGVIASFMFSVELSLGASGAVFGLGGALLFLRTKKSIAFFKNINYNSTLITLLIINVLYGFTNTRIDNYGHLGGLFGGYLCGYIVSKDEVKFSTRILFTLLLIGIITIGLIYGVNKWSIYL